MNGLEEDDFGNIQYQSKSEHLLTLHDSAHPVQTCGNDDKSTCICSNMNGVKEKISDNLKENGTNESQTESMVEFASVLDLSHKCEISAGVEFVKKFY